MLVKQVELFWDDMNIHISTTMWSVLFQWSLIKADEITRYKLVHIQQ